MKKSHYAPLLLMAGLSFGVMYPLMYAMVNSLANVYSNVNQFHMAGLMAAPMIRQQAGMTDRQFLRSMIPHHGGAILMCRQAAIRDAEIKELCREIVSGQQSEIDRMKGMLKRLSEPTASSKQ